MAARSKMPTYLAVGAAGVAGYYLYSAGGSPSAAVKKAEGESCRRLPAAEEPCFD